jgi:four helix bundle protein
MNDTTSNRSLLKPVEPEPLAHERLDVYRVALEFFALALKLTHRLPRTKGQLGDQLARAAESIVLRIAEGAGCEWRSAEQKRYFRAARGSALECSAVLDICRIRRVGSAEQLATGRSLLVRLAQMLTRLCREG